MPACHAGDRGFKSRPDRHYCGSVAQLVEQWPEEPRVGGSTPSGATTYCLTSLVVTFFIFIDFFCIMVVY
jgi:hypothetical protein